MQLIFQTRFSFFGRSAWRSAASQDVALLMDPERLERRFALFSTITLPSLACQTDEDFHLVVLSSNLMPDPYRERLREMCMDVLGERRAHITFRPPASAKKWFKRQLNNHMPPADYSAQIVLDDDDGVSTDFTAKMRAEANLVKQTFEMPTDYSVLSFPRGLSAVMTAPHTQLYHRHMPFTNLGLAVVGAGYQAPNPYGMAHMKIPRRRPSRAIHTREPYYVRTVHDDNDSKGIYAKDIIPPEQMPQIIARFPYLQPLLP